MPVITLPQIPDHFQTLSRQVECDSTTQPRSIVLGTICIRSHHYTHRASKKPQLTPQDNPDHPLVILRRSQHHKSTDCILNNTLRNSRSMLRAWPKQVQTNVASTAHLRPPSMTHKCKQLKSRQQATHICTDPRFARYVLNDLVHWASYEGLLV